MTPFYSDVITKVEESVWWQHQQLWSGSSGLSPSVFCRLWLQDLTERLHRLQVERDSLESKMEAEKHVMRAQLRDMMEKQRAEIQRLSEQHQAQMSQTQQELLGQLEELRRSSGQEASGGDRAPAEGPSVQRIAELEGRSHRPTKQWS